MRWKGIIVVLIFGIGTLFISILFVDRWIESGLEKTGEAITGARVEIDNLNFRLSDLSLQWDRLQITDPKNTMQNWIETGPVAFDMHLPALLRKRINIERLTLSNLRSGTPRKTDGALPRRIKSTHDDKSSILKKTAVILENETKKLSIIRFDIDALKRKVRVDSLINMADLKTPLYLDTAKNELNRLSEKWNNIFVEFHPDEDLKRIENDLKNIDLKKADNLTGMLAVLTKAESAYSRFNTLSRTINKQYSEAEKDFHRIDLYQSQVINWIEADYQSLLKLAKMPDLSAKGVTKMVFGDIIISKIRGYLNILQHIRKIIPKHREKTTKERRPRLKGQTVHFPDRHGWPTFLIEKANISGQRGEPSEGSIWNYTGEMKGITTQPSVYGKLALLNLEAQNENGAAHIWGLLDHTTETTRDTFHIALSNIRLNEMSLQSPYFPAELRNGIADLSCMTRILDENLHIRIDINVKDMSFEANESQAEDLMTRIVQNIFLGMKRLRLQIDIMSEDKEFTLKITSDLDDLVSKELKNLASDALIKAEKAIRNRLNKLYGAEITDLNGLIGSERQSHQSPIQDYKNRTESLKKDFEKKLTELRDEIEMRKQEGGDELEDKARKLLDQLFKKK